MEISYEETFVVTMRNIFPVKDSFGAVPLIYKSAYSRLRMKSLFEVNWMGTILHQ